MPSYDKYAWDEIKNNLTELQNIVTELQTIRDESIQSNTIADAVSDGRFYIATSTRVTASLGDDIRGLITNTSAGKLTVIVALVAHIAPDRMTVGDTFLNPDTGLPTTSYTPFQVNTAVSSPASTTFKIDTGATSLSGGTALDLHLATHKGRNEIRLPGVVLGPGTSLGVNIPLGAVESGDGAFVVYFYEKDI